MTITRFGNTRGLPGLPIITQYSLHNGVVYLLGVTSDGPDVTRQTASVLTRIDTLLAEAGTDKSRLLAAQVWLADMADFDEHNEAWNQWVDADQPPVRACIQAALWQPGLLVEIMVTAALPEPEYQPTPTSTRPRTRS